MTEALERRMEDAERRLTQAERRSRSAPLPERAAWVPAPDQTYVRCSCGHVVIGDFSHVCPPELPKIEWPASWNIG